MKYEDANPIEPRKVTAWYVKTPTANRLMIFPHDVPLDHLQGVIQRLYGDHMLLNVAVATMEGSMEDFYAPDARWLHSNGEIQ
jgi:hypothetical protein